MLTPPPEDPQRLSLEQDLARAVTARMQAGPRPTPDADAIALRQVLLGMTPLQKAAIRSVLGRMEAGLGRPLIACGGISQLLAADRWGPSARPVAEADQALQAAAQGARALIDISKSAWWSKLLAQPQLRIIAALPDDGFSRPRALVVSAETTGPTGDDRTFWVTDSAKSEADIISDLSAAGLAASLLASSGGLKLFVLNGYVQAEDGRLASAPGEICGIIGAAPVF